MSITLCHMTKEQKIPILTINQTEQKVLFSDKTLEALMKNSGITIPAIERGGYSDKIKVTLADPEFYKAFTKIYLSTHYKNPETYKWFKNKQLPPVL